MDKRENKSRLKAYIIISVLFVFGVSYFFYRVLNRSDSLIPRMGPVIEAVYGLGMVIAPRTYQVKSAVSQSIQEIYVKEGDAVKIGSPLMKFDNSGVNRAPFQGTITSIPFKRGEILFPGTAALTLVNLEDLFLEVSLEQQSALRVRREQKVWVSFEAIRGERIEGRVESIFPREAQFIVRIHLSKFPSGILPGMTADVAIEIGRKENILTIPLRSISSGYVTLRRQGKKIKEPIQVGVVDGEWAEVISGNIRSDDEILIRVK